MGCSEGLRAFRFFFKQQKVEEEKNGNGKNAISGKTYEKKTQKKGTPKNKNKPRKKTPAMVDVTKENQEGRGGGEKYIIIF